MTTAQVIKAEQARLAPAYPVARLVKGAVLEAQQAKEEARQILAGARAQADRIRDEATQDREALRAAGIEQARQESAGAFAALTASLEAQVERQRQAFAHEVQRVALRIARAVLDVEFAAHPEHIIRVVEHVLEQASLRREIRIYVHPGAIEHLQGQRDALLERAPAARSLELRADPELSPHDVRVETEWGDYGSTLDERFGQLEQGLAEAAGLPRASVGPAGKEPS